MAGRERGVRAQAPPRKNEYFIPKDGIDREVITADICRYLGNDALVRPGNYEDKSTGVVQQGYFINAYRNLTSAMITDLKLDSDRWGEERRQTASRGQPQNVEYRTSTTHQSRQHYGPSTEQPPASIPGGYASSHASAQGYGQQPAPPSSQQQVVYNSPQYQSSPYASQPAPGGYAAAAPPQQYVPQDTYYLTNTNLRVDHQQGPDRAVQQPRTLPAGGSQYPPAPTYQQQQPDPRGYYAQPAPSPVSSAQSYQQSPDPYYSRAPPPAGGPYSNPTPEVYDSRYQDTGAYSQAPLSSASSATATSGPARREREREPERESKHHRSRR